jgi:hypothetical protein
MNASEVSEIIAKYEALREQCHIYIRTHPGALREQENLASLIGENSFEMNPTENNEIHCYGFVATRTNGGGDEFFSVLIPLEHLDV